MSKKENNEKDDELDKDSRKRLEKLEAQWSETSYFPERLTLADLRLLLERFTPLQDLIRALAAGPADGAPAALAQQTAALRTQVAEAQRAQRAAEHELARVQAELARARSDCRALQHDLDQCSAATQKLLADTAAQASERTQLEQRLQQARGELDARRAQLARAGSAPPELALLRADAGLARALELADLPADDTQALIRTVAVLAQRDNLSRLWEALKARCEADNRPASAQERALLTAALGWYNHNWSARPYRLVEVAPRTPYDFEQHLRSRHAPTGETVRDALLPGIADGSGRLLCKALVSTC